MLAASIDRPVDEPKAWAIVAHCFTCGRKSPGASRISKALADQGIACLRLDFTGIGDSEGQFRFTTLTSNTTDLISAYEHLVEHERAPSLLVGHSLGASASITAARSMPEVQAVAVAGAPFRPGNAIENHASNVCEPDEAGARDIVIAGRRVSLGPEFLASVESYDAAAEVRRLERPLLVLQAPDDTVVPFSDAVDLFRAAWPPHSPVAPGSSSTPDAPASLVWLDGADHRLTVRGCAQRAADIIAAWASPYLPRKPNHG